MTGRNTHRSRRRGRTGTDEILRGLTDVRRRRLLFHLRQSGSATLDELVDVAASELFDEEASGDRASIRGLMHHLDVPLLEELGLVEFDAADGVVRLTADPSELGEWLDLAVRKDVQLELRGESEQADPGSIDLLVVDDDPDLTTVVETYLEDTYEEFAVVTETSVEDAIAAFRQQTFDCIVSDLRMPGISGLDFLKVVREEDPDIPFLLFTGRGSETVASEAIHENVTGYVVKGGETEQFDELAAEIKAAVGRP